MEIVKGNTPLSDIFVGCLLMLVPTVCSVAYSVILGTIWKNNELIKLTSYKFMFLLGIFDVIQCFSHFMTGVFTIFRPVYSYGLAKAMGVLATPAYIAYTIVTVFLSFNRFIQLYSSHIDEMLFSRVAVRVRLSIVINSHVRKKLFKYWICLAIAVWFLFALTLASPWASIIYLPDFYSWNYDSELLFSFYVQKTEMIIELGTILISAVLYMLVIIALYRKRKRFATQFNAKTEIKILIQALVITVYCTVLNFLWHNPQVVLPSNLWSNMALNMMWVGNAGVYPLIYFFVNRAIREKIAARKSHRFTISVFSQAINVIRRKHCNIVLEM